MQLVTRAMLGWPASAAAPQATTRGTKIHYEGTHVSEALIGDHGLCLKEWKAIRTSHLNNKAEGYVDIAYNFGACPHGYLLEGRGLGKETGANGNQALNHAHYSIVLLVGDSGLTEPTEPMLHAARDGIELLQRNGAGTEIQGHRDGYATSCPGEPVYRWVKAGAPRPVSAPLPNPAPPAKASFPAWPGHYLSKGSSGSDVRTFQNQMRKRGWALDADGQFGPKTDAVVRSFQREKFGTKGVDGIVGKLTWNAAFTLPVT